MTARQFADGDRLFAGVGTPLMAAMLALELGINDFQFVVEGGVVDPHIRRGSLPISTNEMRVAVDAAALMPITDVFLLAQRGFLNKGVIGAAQVDYFGNVNTSEIRQDGRLAVRLPGSGGANDIASHCDELIIVTLHERRRFVERVDFLTSPGWLQGGDSRQAAGLKNGGVNCVITDLGVIRFDPPDRRPRLQAVSPDVTVQDVQAQTGFELEKLDQASVLDRPSDREITTLRLLRERPS
jgi:glutaconate CoA-transferase, subunit B